MQVQECTLDLSGGRQVFARIWLGQGEPRGAVLCLHGAESHSEWFEELAAEFSERAFAIVAFDRPGWGRSHGERGHLARYTEAVDQVSEIASLVRERFGAVHLVGLSWGGLLALGTMLRRRFLFDTVTLLSPGVYPRFTPAFNEGLRIVRAGIGLSAKPIPLPFQPADFTRREDRIHYIRNDPLRLRAVSPSFCLETFRMRRWIEKNLSQRRSPPVRLLLAGADSVIDNARTFKLAADNKIPATVYEGAAHSLVFEAPARVASDIAEIVADSELRQRHKRISVIGAGAVGSLVGGLLAVAGHDVTLVGRQRHCDAVRKTGLEIRVAAAFRRIVAGIRPLDAPDAAAKPADLVILAVKSPDTAPAIETLKSFVGPDTVILTLQNGLGHEALIAREFPGNPILAGILCAYLESPLPGTVVWYGDRTCLAATVFSGDPTKARAAWEAALPDTGIPSRFFIGPDMARSVKWSKLVLDSGFNASNAITSLPTARLLRDRQWGTIAVQAMSESFRVMRRLGVRPLNFPGYPLKRLAVLCRLPPVLARPVLAWFMRHEQGGPSSMAQDLKRGQGPTEIDALNGAIVRSADAHGVATPANRLLWDQMKSLASRPSETKS